MDTPEFDNVRRGQVAIESLDRQMSGAQDRGSDPTCGSHANAACRERDSRCAAERLRRIDGSSWRCSAAVRCGQNRRCALGVLPQLRRRLRLLDVLPTAITGHKVVTYLEESCNLAPAWWKRPSSTWCLRPPDADRRRPPASWRSPAMTDASRDTLSGVPPLGNIVRQRLVYEVERLIGNQALSGNATGQNILVFLNATGIGAPACVMVDSNDAYLISVACGIELASRRSL
jgi:hypothetical protein